MEFLPNLNAARVLLAERDPDEMDYTASILEQAGYNVHKAYYVGDAVFALEHNRFDMALVDVFMQDRSRSLLAEHMTRFSGVPWIAIVDDSIGDPYQLLRLGAAAFVQRPFKADVLLRHIKNVSEGQTMAPPSASKPRESAPVLTQNDAQYILEQHLVEQRTLSQLVRSLSAVLELDILLIQVVDAAVSLCHAEEGLLLLPDEDAQTLLIRAAKGIETETARNFRIKTQDTLAGQVFRTGQPVLVGDQGPQKIKTEYLVKSLLYVPLSIKGEIIGVLGINNKKTDRTFDQHDMDLLQDLAAHAAIAIEKAQLYEDSVLRTRELTTLVHAGEAANSTLALDEVLSRIALEMIGALDVSQCYIAEWQSGDTALYPLAVCYRAVWPPTQGPALSRRQNPGIERAFQARRVYVEKIPPRTDNTNLAAWLPHRYQAQGIVYLPLMVDDQPLGIVCLYRTNAPYSDSGVPQGVQSQLQQITLDLMMALAGSDTRQSRSALFGITHRMLEAVDADWCEVALWNTNSRRFNVTLSYGAVIWHEEARPTLDAAGLSQLNANLRDQQATDATVALETNSILEITHGKGLLALPLIVKGEAMGLMILIDTLAERRFLRREIELGQAIVMQAANALDNARLYRDLERSLEELHRTQSKLVQTARLSAMGELAAAVAHQINNPLTTILGDTDLILRDLPPEDVNFESVTAISRAGKRAHEVVRRLLAMARQQNADDIAEPVSVNETIHNTLTLVESHIHHGRIALSVDLDNSLPDVQAIPGQLEDVWLNLLLNARDALAFRPDSQINILTHYVPEIESVEALIWDNGIGIPPETVNQIFDPFFTTKPPGEGTGLGLYICRQIVEKCHGSIHVQSKYNEGTRFSILLPVYHDGQDIS